MDNKICPYQGECSEVCSNIIYSCQKKELFDDFYKLEKYYLDLQDKHNKLKQTLTEIKEIAKFYKKEGRYTTGVVMDKILQICDEVKND